METTVETQESVPSRTGALVRKLTQGLRERQVLKLKSSRELVFRRLKEIPDRLQLMTNQVRLLLDLVDDYWAGEYREVPWHSLAVAVIAVLYFISPSDIIPDYLPAIGHVDDLLFIGLAVRLLKKDMIAYARFKGLDPGDYFVSERLRAMN